MDIHHFVIVSVSVSVVAFFAGCSTSVPTGSESSREGALTLTTCAEVGAACQPDGGEVDTGLVSVICSDLGDSGGIASEFCYCAPDGVACYTTACPRASDGTFPAGCCACPAPINPSESFPVTDGAFNDNGCVCAPGVASGCNNPNAARDDKGKCKGHDRDASNPN